MTPSTVRSKPILLFFFVLIGALLSTIQPTTAQNTDKPNVLYILADDLGYGEIQAYNPLRGKVPTPNVNKLASQGMTFTDAHSASAVCTPTRYAFLTGRYAWRTRLQSGVVGPGGHEPLIKEDRITLAHLFNRRGYHTAGLGKWHLGFKYSDGQKVGSKVIGGPTTRGFNYFWGFPLSRTMETVFENGEVVQKLEPVKMLPTIAQKGANYVREQANDDQPFFLYVALNSPHGPVVPNEQFKGKTGLNDWADYVMETDWAVGQILKALRASGQAQNTLVVFASDNGMASKRGDASELEKMGYYPSAILRGYKRSTWEGGHRIPFIVRWPGVVEPGTMNDHLISLNDFYATVAEMLNIDLPADQGVDSVSILPLLKGRDKPVRNSVIHHSSNGRFAFRKGPWKLILAAGSGGWGQMISDKKARNKGWPSVQLYNIQQDVTEQNNLQSKKEGKARELIKLLEKQVRSGRSTPGPEQENAKKVDIWKGSSDARDRFIDD